MTVKRRMIWLSDERWDTLQQEAKAHGLTPSALIRDWLRDLWQDEQQPRRIGPATDTSRIAAISSESFTAYRPVPKPGK